MRVLLTALLVITVIVGTGYWYQEAHSTCKVPVRYSIGEVDERFELTREEVRAAVADAESLWEDATGHNLFTYDPDSTFAVNFVFDDRQELANEELELSELLDAKRNLSDAIRDEYDALVSQYRELAETYEQVLDDYEDRLDIFNQDVEFWNNQESVPRAVFEELETEEQLLAQERQSLNKLAEEINTLVAEINALGQEGNEQVRDYNENVRDFNDRFNHHREFTQGDYQGDSINIYTFKDDLELRTVLAHELGHALNLGHVDNSQSIMYYLMEGQHEALLLSSADLEEFENICGDSEQTGFLNFLNVL